MKRQRPSARRPNPFRPGPEGYIVQSVGPASGAPPIVIITGTDALGCLYGVGTLLRAVDLGRPGQVGIPQLNLSDAPVFPVRGTDLKFWHEDWAAQLNMGPWSLEQWEEQIADLALWGFNLIWRPLLHTPLDTWLSEQEEIWLIQSSQQI